MPKRAPRIPVVAITRPPMPAFTDAYWITLERGFGSIDLECRGEISHLLDEYVLSSSFEKAAAKFDTAREALEEIRRGAERLRKALVSKPGANYDGTNYAQHKVLNHLQHDLFDGWQASEFGRPVRKDPITLLLELMDATVAAADRGAAEMRLEEAADSFEDPWRQFVLQLTRVLQKHKLPTAARKDSDKTVDKASPFVSFLHGLQSRLPRELRRHDGSLPGLAKAVSQARRKPSTGMQ